MIQRIRPSEYLSDIQAMTEEERKEYLKRVGEWLSDGGKKMLQMTDRPMAKAQNIVQLSTRWTKEDCEAFREGALLLTALVKVADTWLPSQLYARSANRTIRQAVAVLSGATGKAAVAQQHTQQTKQTKKPLPMIKEVKREYNAATNTVRVQMEVVQNEPAKAPVTQQTLNYKLSTLNSAVPVRPKHIDQYVHLLPQKTQEKAATVKGLLRDLDVAREKMRLLMDDPKASADSRALWAKTATKLDEKVKSIYKELDAEWEKLVQSGRVVVDDLGNAHVTPTQPPQGEDTNPDGEEAAKAKRIEYLKKWLRDTRTKASDERRKQWEANCKELLSLGGEITDSIRKAGEVYGVKVDEITK